MIPYPQIDPVFFAIGPLKIRWYGLMYVLGFAAVHILVSYQCRTYRMKKLGEHFENLNFRSHNGPRIMALIAENYPDLLSHFDQIRRDPSMWDIMEEEIEEYCKEMELDCKIEFHHGGFTRNK